MQAVLSILCAVLLFGISAPASAETVISKPKAIAIAKEHMKGKITEVELERENGKLIYEVEFKQGRKEVELQIDAITGEVIGAEKEANDGD